MHKQSLAATMALAAFVPLALSLAFFASPPAQAQAQGGPPPQVSVVNLQAVRNPDGTQSVITPKGDLAPLPGAGVAGDVAQIFIGAQGGFWYTDKSGRTIDLNPTVQALNARRAQMQQAQQVPQYAPAPYQEAPPPQQEQQYSDSGSGGSALGTAAAAGMGAMAGAAMSNAFYNAPYGTPMYYGPGGRPYYYDRGERREINELSPNQKAVLYNKNQVEKQNKQQALQQRQQNQAAQSQSARQPQFDQQRNFQSQQQWYQQQLSRNPQQFKGQGSNPFVSQQSSRGQSIGQRPGGDGLGGRSQASASRGGSRGGSIGGGGRGGGGRGGGGRRR